jgi:hypothetical protein
LLLLPHHSADKIGTEQTSHRLPSTQRTSRSHRRYSQSSSARVDVDGEDKNDFDEDYVEIDNDGDSTRTIPEQSTIRYTTKQNERWNEMYQKLIAYKREHNSTSVTRSCKEDPKLGSWVGNQRMRYKNKTISDHCGDRLNSVRFVWIIIDQVPWVEMFQRLVTYKKEHKSTNVLWKYPADPRLGNWVHSQRQDYTKKDLSIERINRLELIGFIWDPRDARWMEMYHRLLAYKKQYRSTKVPSYYTEDPQLGKWVSGQRGRYRKNKLTEKRLELLNSIKFAWSVN